MCLYVCLIFKCLGECVFIVCLFGLVYIPLFKKCQYSITFMTLTTLFLTTPNQTLTKKPCIALSLLPILLKGKTTIAVSKAITKSFGQ